MAARIDDDFMTAEYDGRVIATARYSVHAAADGQGAWLVSDWAGRLFTRNQAIAAMVLANGSPPASLAWIAPADLGERDRDEAAARRSRR